MATVKFIGVTDSVTACGCCGKSPLKKTVCLEIDGDELYFGTTCAGRALGTQTRTVKDVQAAVFRANKLEQVKTEVDRRRSASDVDWVYGRYYVNPRSYKTELGIHIYERGKTISRVYPAV